MRRPKDVSEEDLVDIAERVQDWLFFDSRTAKHVRDREVNGGDFVEAMFDLLDSLGMAPDGAEELERKAKHEDFAKFVGDLMKGEPKPVDVVCEHCGQAGPSAHTKEAFDDDALLGSLADAVQAADEPTTAPLVDPVAELLRDFAEWSGGFEPAETSNEERNTFLIGRTLDAAQEAAMWPERQAVRS